MKKTMMFLAAIFLAIAVALPALAQETLPPDPNMSGRFSANPPGEFIIVDAVILRPLGLASMAVGAIGAGLAAPWITSPLSCQRVNRELLQKPAWYTFGRPLGDSDF
ncbi:MAG: hypothetical protein P4L55_14500 [Syntrophobacteraceae bacterium]|nr:hypothetical protein [Syntrophobacteraceae bacterium]